MNHYESYTKEELFKIIGQLEQELEHKKYGLVWDKEREPEQVVVDCQDNLPILKEVKDKHIKTDDSDDNILIEGDNYHALSVLNYTHENKIDVIYIDPPYNTGNKDFIYNDRFVDKEDKYRHSKWLNFMEKRLNLAYELLKKNGVVFISIDDNEVYNLKLLCDRIFGEGNFIANCIVINNIAGRSDKKHIAQSHEYCLIYQKSSDFVSTGLSLSENLLNEYKYKDEKGQYRLQGLRKRGANSRREDRPNLYYPIFYNEKNEEIFIEKQDDCVAIYPLLSNGSDGNWRWSKSTLLSRKQDLIVKKNKNKIDIFEKVYLYSSDSEEKTTKMKSFLFDSDYTTDMATTILKEIIDSFDFNNPKSIFLLKDIVKIATPLKNEIILDFFAGSGTTAHAVMELNKQDGGNRKYIVCTNNENNICHNVTYPRIEKVINGYTTPKGKTIDGLGGNLKYFKAELLPKSQSYYQTKVSLVNECTEMLCVKENIYNLHIQKDDYKIFLSNDKSKYLAVYYNTLNNSTKEFLAELKKIKEEKIIYIFSDTQEVNQSIFKGIKNFRVEAIPQKILDVYKELGKQNISPKTNTIFVDLDKAKRRIFSENDKDDGASKLRIVLEQILEYIAFKNGFNLNDFSSIARLNTKLKDDGVITKVRWKEIETYLTIGNDASHGDYDNYEMKQVKEFYRFVQGLITEFSVGK